MKQTTKMLIWKSYRDVRWFVFSGLAVMVFPSFIEACQSSDFSTDMPEGLVLAFGGIFAILIAMAVTCRDLREPILTFWSSRPIETTRFILVKYVVGLVALLLVCVPPFFLQFSTLGYKDHFGLAVLWAHTPTLLLIFSVAFAAGCLIRETVGAALFALGGLVLIYCAPLVVPGLSFLETFHWFEERRFRDFPLFIEWDFTRFFFSMLSLSALAAWVSVIAVRRGIIWKIGRRTIASALALVGLLLFWGASRELGTNLKVEKTLKPDMGEFVQFHLNEGKGIAGIQSFSGAFRLISFDASVEPQQMEQEPFYHYDGADPHRGYYRERDHPAVWSPTNPDRAYTFIDRCKVTSRTESGNNRTTGYTRTNLELATIDLTKTGKDAILDKTDLIPLMEVDGRSEGRVYSARYRPELPQMFLVSERLFVHQSTHARLSQVLFFDVSNPDAPKYIKTFKQEYEMGFPSRELALSVEGESFSMQVRSFPSLSRRECLETFIGLSGESDRWVLAKDWLVSRGNYPRNKMGLRTYRVTGLEEEAGIQDDATSTTGTFLVNITLLDLYKPSVLTKVMGGYSYQVVLNDGLCYDLTGSSNGPGITVYDLRDPEQIKRVGHFAMGDDRIRTIAHLPGGRLLTAGEGLYFLAPPKLED